MGDIIGQLIECIVRIWSADTEIREGSLLGESEFDRKAGRSVAWLCGGAIFLLALGWLIWWWCTRDG